MQEDRETGRISFHVIKRFFALMGGIFILIFCYLFMQYAAIGEYIGNYWLYNWAENYIPDDKWRTFIYWTIFQMAWSCSHTIRAGIYCYCQVLLSRKTHRIMLFKVLHSKIDQFLDRVPIGRIINRFSKDMAVIDGEIIGSWTGFLITFAYSICSMVLIIYTTTP